MFTKGYRKKSTNQWSDTAPYRTISHHIAPKSLQNLKSVLISKQETDRIQRVIESMRLRVVIDKRQKQNGKHPIKIRIAFKGKTAYIPIGQDVHKHNFIDERAIGPSSIIINAVIESYMQRTMEIIGALISEGVIDQFASVVDLRDYIADIINASKGGVHDVDERTTTILKYRIEYYVRGRKKNYVNSFVDTCNKVATFADIEMLRLEDITVSWLKDFERHCLSSGMTANGVAHYMRNIRTIYNDAIDRDLIPINDYPFRRYKIKREPTAHRALTLDELREVIDFDVEGYHASSKYRTHDVQRAIDVFMLSFYFAGINVRDLCLAKGEDFSGGRFVTAREKTGEPISLAIQPEAQEIIDRHRGVKYYLDFMDIYKNDDVHNFVSIINRALKVINPKLTTYWARHTWATLASELDVTDAIIDMAQGRKPTGVTSIYVKRNITKADTANRKVIDYVSGYKKGGTEITSTPPPH